MQPLLNGMMLGAVAGLTLAFTNTVSKTVFGTGWIDWTVGKVNA